MAGLVRDLLAATGEPRGARSRCAPPTTASTSRRSRAPRAAAATAAPPASRPTDGLPAARRVPAGGPGRAAALSDATGSSSIDKPAGITSHDVVASVRRRLGRGVKVGHAGTLDPFATGLLLVLVGRATRVQRFLMALPKRYETVARLGWTSTTGDRRRRARAGPHARRAARAADRARCASARRPTRAVKVGGRRAYELARARRGGRAAPSARSRSRASSCCGARATAPAFAIECSSGTYVRALIADLGDAYCLELRRTAIGHVRRRRRRPGADHPARRRARLPARRRRSRATTRGGPATAWRCPARREGTVRLLDERRPDRPRRAAGGRACSSPS